MTKREEQPVQDDMFDIGNLDGFYVPDSSFVTYADVANQRIIITGAEEAYGEFGRYFKITLTRHNSNHQLYMNVGAEQPCNMIEKILATGKFPAKAKFVKDGRTNVLVGWAHGLKR